MRYRIDSVTRSHENPRNGTGRRPAVARPHKTRPGLECLEWRITPSVTVDYWTGSSLTSNNWMDGANWQGGNAPSPGDELVFPTGVTNKTATNDFPAGTVFNSIEIDDPGYTFSGGNSVALNTGITSTYTSGSLTFPLDVTLDASQTVSVAGGGTLDVSGTISGGFALIKAGAGVLQLDGNNSYSGGTAINDGIVLVHNNANVFGTGTVTVNSDSTASTRGEVQITSTSLLTIPNAFVLNSNDAAGDPVIQNILGTNFISGPISLQSDATIAVNSGTILDSDGSISGTASLTETGSGRLVLGASSSYSGGTFVDGGNLAIDWPTNAAGTGAITINNAAQMLLFTESNFTSSIVMNNAITLNTTSAAAIDNTNGPSTLNGPITLKQSATIEADSGATLIITGAIGDGGSGYGITETGADTVQLSGTSTYTGTTTVSGGILEVDGSIATSNGVNVVGGALTGTGAVPGVTATGGAIAPGTPSGPRTLNSGSVSLATGSSFNVGLNGTAAGSFTQLNVTGTVDLDSGASGGATLNVTLGYTPSIGDSYTIIANDGTDPISNTFNGLPEGAHFSAGGQTFEITYAGGPNQNQVVLTDKVVPTVSVTAAPEPSQFGQSVTFDATVSGANGTPTGSVTFYDGDPANGGQPIGAPQPLDGSGHASLSTASLSVGSHQIFALYSGDSTYTRLASALPGTQDVGTDATATSLSSAQPSTVYGTDAIFTALVSQAFGGTPTGTVDFFDGANPIGSGTLNSLGIATLVTTNLSVSGSPHAITAVYEGSPTSQGSTSPNYSQTISPAALTIVADSLSKSYGQTVTFDGSEFAALGLVNGDSVDSVTLSSAGAAATATVAGSPYTIDASGAVGSGLGNYTITYLPGQLTVAPAALTITANSTSKTYGDTVNFNGTEFTTSGLVNGDSVDSVTLSSAGVAATATVAGSPYNIDASGAIGSGLDNYTITYAPGQLTVTPAPLTITADSTSKTYGQTVTFAGTEFTTSGLVNGDTVGSVTLNSAGAAGTATVAGSPYAINASGAVGSGLDNYTITYAPGQLAVAPAALTITANSTSKTYGQTVTFAGTEFSTSGLVNSDHVDLVSLTSAGAAATAGVAGSPYAINASGAVGSGLDNYTITYAPGQLAVAPAALTITADSTSKTYGQTVTFAGTEFRSSGLLNGDTVSSVTLASAGAAATAGVAGSPYAISASNAVGTGLGNYTVSYVPGQLTITPAPLTITAKDATKTYGQALTFAGTEFTASGLVNGDNVSSVTLNSAGAPASAGVAGSPYAISASSAVGTGLDNYSIMYAPGQLSVAPAPLTITANDVSRPYGAPNPSLTASYSGFVNGDTPASLANPVALTTTATPASPVGQYPIVAAGASSPNYAITFQNGTLSVTQASSTIVLIAPTTAAMFGQRVSYSALVHSAGGSVPSGSVLFLVDGQPAAQASIDPNTGLATFATSNLSIGTHAIAAEFPVNSNIAASSSAASTLVVSPASTSAVVAAHYVTKRAVDVGASVTPLPPGGGTPTGTVTFFVGRRRLGTTQLVGGTADLLVRPGQVRNRPLTVQYGGDANFLPTSSAAAFLGGRGAVPAVRPSAAAHRHSGHHSRTH